MSIPYHNRLKKTLRRLIICKLLVIESMPNSTEQSTNDSLSKRFVLLKRVISHEMDSEDGFLTHGYDDFGISGNPGGKLRI